MVKTFVIIAMLAGCGGGKKDDCERLVDRIEGISGEKQINRDKRIEACRKDIDRIRRDPRMKCLLDAEGDSEIQKCIESSLKGGHAESADDDPQRLAEEKERARKAELAAEEAVKQAREAKERVDKIEQDLGDLSKKLDAAVDAITQAQNEADRKAATARLEELRKEKAEMERRIAEAKAAAARAERTKGVHISKECMDNPLAKGCQ